ncbi:MAG TPA: hypothetical protein PLE30_04440 [Candidatus Kapabacteria bacterium]|nr:hypothetical protein [Candidatus Kapabacteria bacterium]
MTIAEILKDSNYKLTQFSQEQIEKLEKSIITKTLKDKEAYYTTCLVRKKEIKLTPEEAVTEQKRKKCNFAEIGFLNGSSSKTE